MGAYYSGQKGIDDVVSIIQNCVLLYVNGEYVRIIIGKLAFRIYPGVLNTYNSN